MKHLQIKIEKLEFEWNTILEDIHLTLNQNERIALVWPNGTGKSSLLKVITENIKHFHGSIQNIGNMSLGYLEQIYSDQEEKSVFEELECGFEEIKKLQIQIQKLEYKMEQDNSNIELINEYTLLLEQFNTIGWHEYKNKIHAVANGMWFLELLDKKLCEISGWQRTKVALWKILLAQPDILLLDEPTNFIDMNGVEWLESYLNNKWKGWYVIISHDREFLDRTCKKTYELQPKNWLNFYHCNYSSYVEERKKIEKKKKENYKREQEFIQKEEQLINRFRAGSRAWWAKSREKSLEKMEKLKKPYIPKQPKFFFEYIWEGPQKVMTFKETFIWRQEPLFFIWDTVFHHGQKIWIIWENWVWKSTLLKTIIWQIPVLDGQYLKWKWIQICYYSQLHEELHKEETMRENFIKHGIEYPDQHLIWLIKHYLFEKEDLDKKVKYLSGGQMSKLLFCILSQKPCNLLIMDEPTNHLDYDTREALESALAKFEWSILFISHDRYFVNKVASHIWFIENGELSISYGNYSDYRFKQEYNLDMDMSLFDEEAELNMVLESKIWEKEFKKLKEKFSKKKRK